MQRNREKREETGRNGKKWKESGRNGQKRAETGRNGKKQNGKKGEETGSIGKKREEHGDGDSRKHLVLFCQSNPFSTNCLLVGIFLRPLCGVQTLIWEEPVRM